MKGFLFLLCFIPFTLLGQRYVSGRITNAEDNKPVSDVTVFISYTTVGTATDLTGHYRLAIPSEGSYELNISHVAYQSVTKHIASGSASVEFNIELQINELEEVVLETKVPKRKKDINLFWESILGERPSKRRIKVVNPESVYYYFNSNTQILTVTGREPLQIINNETGYQIQYVLNSFKHNYNTGVTERNQQFKFTELEPTNLKQKNRWEQKRQEIYNVSLEKFIRSLYNNALYRNGFVLGTFHQNDNSPKSIRISVLNPDSLLSTISTDNSRTLTFPKEEVLLICYGRPVTDRDLNRINETEGKEFLENDGLKINLLHGDSIHIFPDGTFTNSLQVGSVNSSNTITALNRRIPIDYIQDNLSLVTMKDESGFVSDSIFQYFDIQRQVFPQEKLHLHTDRDIYVPGERIWFKAYVADATTHRYSTQSRYVYVELISPEDTLVHRVMVRPEEGMFYGYMPITEVVPQGDYTLRAYTRYMENIGDDYFFKKHIKIIPLSLNGESAQKKTLQSSNINTKTGQNRQDFEVSFFPEGGNLLDGTKCKVAFKALNSDGTPATITGEIIDENGLVVTSVESLYAGMGMFFLFPEPNKKYMLKCRNSNGLEKRFDLPQSYTEAYTLAVGRLHLEKKIAVEVCKSINAPDIPFYLLAHSRGIVLHFSTLDNANELTVFSEEDLPAGIIHLMLFDKQMNPLSERLVFNKNNVDMGEVDFYTDKITYGRREKVVVTLSLTDDLSNLLSGNLSVAVTDNKDKATDSSTTILSTLLLSSELKGYINNLSYYLQDDRASMIALDYLMMTHGWRRYNVPEVVKGNMGLPQTPYQTSQQIAGNVKSLILSRPVSNSEILITAEQDMGLIFTDGDGTFTVQDFEYPDSTTYFIQALGNKGSRRVKLALEDELFPPVVHLPRMLVEEMQAFRKNTTSDAMSNAFLVKAGQRSQYDEDIRVVHLSEVEVTAPIIKKEPRLEFWANRNATKTIQREQIEHFHLTTVSDVLRMAGVNVSSKGEISLGGDRPLILIDGVYQDWPEDMFSIYESPIERVNVNTIESIDIISKVSAAIFGVRGTSGAISITTKRGKDVPVESYKENVAIFTPLGYQKPVAFYSPKYDTPEAKTLTVPDYRTTIFWKPDVVISDEQEVAGFEFYTSDFPTTYSVVIEGLTTDGKIVRQVKEITVE